MDGIIERIKAEMKNRGMTQKSLADELCVHHSTVSWWLSGKSVISEERLCGIAKVFGCSVEYLRSGNSSCEDTTLRVGTVKKTSCGVEVRRGDIFYVENGRKTIGSEIAYNRPAVIVSNDANNRFSGVVEIVWLTTSEKAMQRELPTHVPVICKVPSTALCEQVNSVSKERLRGFIKICTDKEMQAIDRALMVSLGLDLPLVTDVTAVERVNQQEIDDLKMKLEGAERELDEMKEQIERRQLELEDKDINLEELRKHLREMIERKREAEAKLVDAPNHEELIGLKAKVEILEKQNEKLLDRLIG